MNIIKEEKNIVVHENSYYWGTGITIVYENGKGIVSIDFLKDTGIHRREGYGFIHGLSVLEEERNRGIGSAALALAEVMIKERGRSRAALDIEARDSRARRFYRERGYTEVKEERYETDYGEYERMEKIL